MRQGVSCELLLSARRNTDFPFRETGIGNRNKALAAFAFEFKIIPLNFCDQMAACTPGFTWLNVFLRQRSVVFAIHGWQREQDDVQR